MHVASWQGHLDTVDILIDEGGDESVHQKSYAGNTPLHLASWKGHLEVVKRLYQVGGRLLLVSSSNQMVTALQLSTHCGQVLTAQWLLEQEMGYKKPP